MDGERNRSNLHVESVKNASLAEMEDTIRQSLIVFEDIMRGVAASALDEVEEVTEMGKAAHAVLLAKTRVVEKIDTSRTNVERWVYQSEKEEAKPTITIDESLRLLNQRQHVVLALKMSQKARALGIAFSDLAPVLGVAESVVERMMTGDTHMTRDDLEKINLFLLSQRLSEDSQGQSGSEREILTDLVVEEVERDVQAALNKLRIAVLASTNFILNRSVDFTTALEWASEVIKRRNVVLADVRAISENLINRDLYDGRTPNLDYLLQLHDQGDNDSLSNEIGNMLDRAQEGDLYDVHQRYSDLEMDLASLLNTAIDKLHELHSYEIPIGRESIAPIHELLYKKILLKRGESNLPE
jgi:hypothetical protein